MTVLIPMNTTTAGENSCRRQDTAPCPRVLPPSVLSNVSKHDLKFTAAATRQIPVLSNTPNPTPLLANSIENNITNFSKTSHEGKKLLVASPYIDDDHLLDLDSLARPHALFAEALTAMANLTSEYATEKYAEAFNWDEVLQNLRKLVSIQDQNSESNTEISKNAPSWIFPQTEFYIIVFRSQVPLGLDRTHLFALDKEAHREAVQAGQLLKYWFGSPHPETGRNLATCVWRNRGDARKGGCGPGHRKAMEAVRKIYLDWGVERLKLTISEGATSWDIAQWTD